MDNGSSELPPVELPQPNAPNLPARPEYPHEKSAAQATETGQAAALPPLPPVQPASPAQSAAPVAPPDPSQGQASQPGVALPPIADDTDLIEKEWVDRAKHIVEQTKHDPYQQNKEITKAKADYLRKRYNKDIKLSAD